MPIVYEDVVRGRTRSAFDLPASTGEVLTETFAQAYEENPIMAFSRMLELREDQRTGPRLSVEQARARLSEAGMEADIEVGEAGITEAALNTLMSRKRIEKRRQETFALAEGGFGQGAARLGVAAITTLADPVSAALNFVPVVGQARYARMLGGAGTLLGRTGVRLGVGAAEGAAGAAIVEPLIYAMRTQEQADYDAVDSLLNVALGGVIGSGLHTTVGSLGELFARPAPSQPPSVDVAPANLSERVDRLPAQDQHALVRASVAQAVAGEPVNVSRLIDMAEHRLLESEVNARLDAEEARLRPLVEADVAAGRTLDRTEAQFRDMLARTEQVQADHARRLRELDEADRADSASTPNDIERLVERMRANDPSLEPYLRTRLATTDVAANLRKLAEDLDAAERAGRRRVRAEDRADLVRKQNEIAEHANQLRRTLEEAIGARNRREQLEALTQGRREAQNLRDRVNLLPPGVREQFMRRLDAVEADLAVARASAPESAPRADEADYRAATQAADQALKTAPPDAPDALPPALDDLAGQAEAEARVLAERLGVEFRDADLDGVAEAAEKAERWARAAELATMCLVRGG